MQELAWSRLTTCSSASETPNPFAASRERELPTPVGKTGHVRTSIAESALWGGLHSRQPGRPMVVAPAGDRFRVSVDLTIRDMTRPVVLDAEFLGIFPGMQGGRRVGLRVTGSLARKEWGLDWNVALEAGG